MSEKLKKYLDLAPLFPGVYYFYDKQNTVIYVGKANNIYKRLSSYFQKKNSSKTLSMLARACKIDFLITCDQFQATKIEQSVIANLRPVFNIKVEEDRIYYVSFNTDHAYPSLLISYKPTKNCFGPYSNLSQAKSMMRSLQEIFLLRTCKDSFFANRSMPCQLYNLGLCSAPCVFYINKKDYNLAVKNAIKTRSIHTVKKHLTKSMDFAAKQHNFGLAIQLRERIKNINVPFSCAIPNKFDHVSTFIGVAGSDIFYICILSVQQNVPIFKRIYHVEDLKDIKHILKDYENIIKFPIKFLSYNKEISSYIPSTKYTKINLPYWQNICDLNAINRCSLTLKQQLQHMSKFFDFPIKVVESVDISHQHGKNNFAVFVSSEGHILKYPLDSTYDDYLSMRSAIKKRIQSSRKMPDLFIIDGGRGQLSSFTRYTTVRCISLAKRKEIVYDSLSGKAVNTDSICKMLISHMIKLAHSASNKVSKTKDNLVNLLMQVQGIGLVKATQISKFFSLTSLITSSQENVIKNVKGINVNLVAKIKSFLKKYVS